MLEVLSTIAILCSGPSASKYFNTTYSQDDVLGCQKYYARCLQLEKEPTKGWVEKHIVGCLIKKQKLGGSK